MVGDIAQDTEFSPRENIRSFYRIVMGVMPGLAETNNRDIEPQCENVFSRTLWLRCFDVRFFYAC